MLIILGLKKKNDTSRLKLLSRGIIRRIRINDFLNIIRTTHNDRNTLMNNLRLYLHDPLPSGRTQTTRLLHDKTHGSSLVQQTKLAIGVFGISGISKDTSIE